MFISLSLAIVGLWFFLWPNSASHTFVWGRPRATIVRLIGLVLLSLLAWLILVQRVR